MSIAPITDQATARTLIERAIAWNSDPALTTVDVDTLLSMAESTNATTSATEWTVADLNRVASLGWSWKAGIASASFSAGVGPGKTFELQQQYDHAMQMSELYAAGHRSVVGSVNVDDGTGRPTTGGIATVGFITERTTT